MWIHQWQTSSICRFARNLEHSKRRNISLHKLCASCSACLARYEESLCKVTAIDLLSRLAEIVASDSLRLKFKKSKKKKNSSPRHNYFVQYILLKTGKIIYIMEIYGREKNVILIAFQGLS